MHQKQSYANKHTQRAINEKNRKKKGVQALMYKSKESTGEKKKKTAKKKTAVFHLFKKIKQTKKKKKKKKSEKKREKKRETKKTKKKKHKPKKISPLTKTSIYPNNKHA